MRDIKYLLTPSKNHTLWKLQKTRNKSYVLIYRIKGSKVVLEVISKHPPSRKKIVQENEAWTRK